MKNILTIGILLYSFAVCQELQTEGVFNNTIEGVDEVNGTNTANSSSTDAPPVSTPEPISTVAPELDKKKKADPKNVNKFKDFEAQQGFCTCDLIRNTCDINCCCDKDCSATQIDAFTECISTYTNEQDRYDLNYCYQSRVVYRNNTPTKIEEYDTGLFCVTWDNRGSSTAWIYPDKNPLSIPEVKKLQSKDAYSWAASFSVNKHTGKQTDANGVDAPQKSSDPILIINHDLRRALGEDENESHIWALPESIFSPDGECEVHKPVQYLKEIDRSCSIRPMNMSDLCKPNTIFDSSYYYKSQSFVKSSFPELNETNPDFKDKEKEMKELCMKEGWCLPIETDMQNIKSISRNKTHCLNVTTSFSFQVWHNGTNGITRAKVHFEYADLLIQKKASISQRFRVQFQWWNATMSEDQPIRSGSPGYVTGMPLIVSHMEMVKDKNMTQPIQNFTIVPNGYLMAPSSKTYCSILYNHKRVSMEDRDKVLFGINSLRGCFLDLQRFSTNKLNCKNLKKTIALTLNIPQMAVSSNVNYLTNITHVGTFGSANINDTDDWVPIMLTNDAGDIKVPSAPSNEDMDPPTKTVDKEKEEPDTDQNDGRFCKDVPTEWALTIYYTKIGHAHQPQDKVIGALLKVTGIRNVDLTPILRQRSGKAIMKVNSVIVLKSAVSFSNVATMERSIHAPPPTFKMQLPNDFFYPFFRQKQRSNY